jgi:hypothetical protein
MKLEADMNLSPRWVHLLTEAGLDAVHWLTIGEDSTTLLTIDPKRVRLRIAATPDEKRCVARIIDDDTQMSVPVVLSTPPSRRLCT